MMLSKISPISLESQIIDIKERLRGSSKDCSDQSDENNPKKKIKTNERILV